ncbi:YjaG family protein [Pasteurella sp. P03HT]
MRNPIHKRLENLEAWQHVTFMACLCERMLPNFQLFCHVTQQEENAKRYQNILNLVWESLTVKGAKINFESQLEKLEHIIPDINEYDFYGIVPAVDACEGLSELLHAIIAGATLEQAIKLSQLSLQTVTTLLEAQAEQELSENALKESEEIQQELDVQWQIYRVLKDCESRDVELILSLKSELRESGISNIGIQIEQ